MKTVFICHLVTVEENGQKKKCLMDEDHKIIFYIESMSKYEIKKEEGESE